MGYWRRGTRGLDCWHARRYQKGLGCLHLKPCPWDVPCWRVMLRLFPKSAGTLLFISCQTLRIHCGTHCCAPCKTKEARARVIERGWVVASGYSWERCAEQTLALYRECL